MFARPPGYGCPVGIEWGFFLAFVAAGAVAFAGLRMRAAERPEPPMRRSPGDPIEARHPAAARHPSVAPHRSRVHERPRRTWAGRRAALPCRRRIRPWSLRRGLDQDDPRRRRRAGARASRRPRRSSSRLRTPGRTRGSTHLRLTRREPLKTGRALCARLTKPGPTPILDIGYRPADHDHIGPAPLSLSRWRRASDCGHGSAARPSRSANPQRP